MPDATLKQVSDFMKTGDPARDTLAKFRSEWQELPEKDKAEIKKGIGNGTLTY